jgi:cytochrome c-type biogenesis protein CcmE
MTRKQRRLAFVAAGMGILGISVALVLVALEENIIFFFSPTDIVTKQVPTDRRLRLGGLVVKGSVARKPDGLTTEFRVTDMANTVPVTFRGVLPDLFREGQGVIVQGKFASDGWFRADEVLAKHDETYMPPEVADALKRSGVWQGKENK